MRPMSLALLIAVTAGCPSGCKQASDQPRTAEQIKQAAAAVSRPEPGMYRTTITIADVRFPGLPAGQAERMKSILGASGKTVEFCLTPEDAGKGFEDFNKRAAEGKCSYDSFNAASGTLDAKMTCQTGRGMTTRSELHGTFSGTGSQLTMKTDSAMPGMPGGGLHMEARVTNERIGDCT